MRMGGAASSTSRPARLHRRRGSLLQARSTGLRRPSVTAAVTGAERPVAPLCGVDGCRRCQHPSPGRRRIRPEVRRLRWWWNATKNELRQIAAGPRDRSPKPQAEPASERGHPHLRGRLVERNAGRRHCARGTTTRPGTHRHQRLGTDPAGHEVGVQGERELGLDDVHHHRRRSLPSTARRARRSLMSAIWSARRRAHRWPTARSCARTARAGRYPTAACCRCTRRPTARCSLGGRPRAGWRP